MIEFLLGVLLAAQPSPGQAAYEKANRLFVEKKLPDALASVEVALRLDANLVPALTLKAKLAMAANRYDVARKNLEHALRVDPKSAYAWFLSGMEAYLSNEMKEALPRFHKARQLAPADPRAALYLGLATESVGQPEEALAQYREAVRLERESGKPDADTLLPGARLLLLLGKTAEAEDWVRQAVRLAPGSRDARFELARVLLKKGEPDRAAEEGERALTLAGGSVADSPIRYLLIQAYQRAGKPDRVEIHAAVIRAQER